MNGDAELPHRSSSPLKRTASSMDSGGAPSKNGSAVETDSSHSGQETDISSSQLPRAMSLDAPDVNGQEAPSSQCKMILPMGSE